MENFGSFLAAKVNETDQRCEKFFKLDRALSNLHVFIYLKLKTF